jgi:hypothetical protein
VIVSETSYISSTGYFVIVGEIQNTGSVYLKNVQAEAVFYDASGNFIERDVVSTALAIIPPGEKAPFQITNINPSGTQLLARYALQIGYQQSPTVSPIKLVLNLSSSNMNASGSLRISGDVENQGNSTENVKVVATCYDGTGKVVATGNALASPSNLAQGQFASFQIAISSDRASLVRSYSIVAESSAYQSVPVPEFASVIAIGLAVTGVAAMLLSRRQSASP